MSADVLLCGFVRFLLLLFFIYLFIFLEASLPRAADSRAAARLGLPDGDLVARLSVLCDCQMKTSGLRGENGNKLQLGDYKEGILTHKPTSHIASYLYCVLRRGF